MHPDLGTIMLCKVFKQHIVGPWSLLAELIKEILLCSPQCILVKSYWINTGWKIIPLTSLFFFLPLFSPECKSKGRKTNFPSMVPVSKSHIQYFVFSFNHATNFYFTISSPIQYSWHIRAPKMWFQSSRELISVLVNSPQFRQKPLESSGVLVNYLRNINWLA